MLLAFRGKCPEGFEACHNNGIRTDNRLENLRWDSKSGNMADKLLHKTDSRGENNPKCKLNEKLVREIRLRYEAGNITKAELGRQYSVSKVLIGLILSRKLWAHVD